MQEINSFLTVVDSYIGGSQWFVYALLGTGLFFTIYLGFPQIRFFRHSIRVVSGKYDEDGHKGDTSHFQALTAALSGTIGTGNIAGVALAIHLGGPAALFWMLMTAFVGMTTKMVEVTLSHKYRETTDDGSIAGGPMYYMKNRLNMKWLGSIFAIATVIASFGMCFPQINSISNSMFATFGISHYLTGFVLAVLLGLIIIGGIKRIVKITEKLIPLMTIVYLLGAIGVLITNYDNIIPAIISVFANVFSGTAVTGGFLGATFMWAFNRGVNRGLFSNEAGEGSAAIAHAAAKTNEPVSEGFVALLEPFIDTIIVCSLTGIVLLSSGVWQEKHHNRFQQTDIIVLANKYDEYNSEQRNRVAEYVVNGKSIPLFSGSLRVKDGQLENDLTILHCRSFAEDIFFSRDGLPYTGNIEVSNGAINTAELMGANPVSIEGLSLLHSAPLTSQAFKKSIFGDWGEYIIPITLLMFAFSTAVAWAYYGDRGITFIWGFKFTKPYHFVYMIGAFVAAFADTTIVWTFSGIAVALMTLPNLFGILLLHKDVKNSIKDYWNKHKNGKLMSKS